MNSISAAIEVSKKLKNLESRFLVKSKKEMLVLIKIEIIEAIKTEFNLGDAEVKNEADMIEMFYKSLLDNNQRQKEHLKECAILEKQNEVLREKNNKLKATVKSFS